MFHLHCRKQFSLNLCDSSSHCKHVAFHAMKKRKQNSTNRFHDAKHLFNIRSQMASKFVRTKKKGTDILTTFWCLLWFITEQTQGNIIYLLFYMIERQDVGNGDVSYTSVYQLDIIKNQPNCIVYFSLLYKPSTPKISI